MLRQADGIERVEAWQLRIILRADAENVELALAAFDGDIVFFIGGDGDDPVRQTADHFTEESGPYDHYAALGNIGFYAGDDALLEIIALDIELILGADLKTLQCGDGAFGGGSAGGDTAGCLEQIFFTAELHNISSEFISLSARKKGYIFSSNSSRQNNCGKAG